MKSNLGVTVILVKNNQVLLGKRINAYGEGSYGLPGGRVSDKETIEDCLKRELKEEVGVSPVEFRLLGVVKEWQKTNFFIHFVYLCTKWRGIIRTCEPDKCEEWYWFDLINLPEPILNGHQLGLRLLGEDREK